MRLKSTLKETHAQFPYYIVAFTQSLNSLSFSAGVNRHSRNFSYSDFEESLKYSPIIHKISRDLNVSLNPRPTISLTIGDALRRRDYSHHSFKLIGIHYDHYEVIASFNHPDEAHAFLTLLGINED